MSPRASSGPDATAHGDRWVLGGILLLGALVRGLAWARTAVLFNDGPIFLAMAEAIRAGRIESVLAHPQHPLYPALIALGTSLGLAPESAAVAVSIAGGLLAIFAIHALAARAFGPVVARGSALVVALHPTAVDFTSDVLSDGLYLGLFLAALAEGVALFTHPTRGRALRLGALVGLADWTRPEGLGLIGLAGLLALHRFVRRPEERRALGRMGIVALALAALLAGGLRAGEWRVGGELVLSQKKSVGELARGGPSAEALAEDRRLRRAAREQADALPVPEGSVRADSAAFDRPPRTWTGLFEAVARVGQTALSAFRYELIPFLLLGLGLGRGIARGEGGREAHTPARRAFDAWVGLVGLGYGGVLVLLVWGAGYVSRRHALPVVLPLVPYAVVGWLQVEQAVRVRLRKAGSEDAEGMARGGAEAVPRRGLARSGALVALALGLLLAWGARDLRARRVDRAAEREAAVWLASPARGEGGVAAQKLRTAYYAKAPFVPLPDGRDGLIQDQIRGRGARWVVIDAAKLDDHLGLAEGIGHWLEEVHVVRSGEQAVLVLELVGAPAD